MKPDEVMAMLKGLKLPLVDITLDPEAPLSGQGTYTLRELSILCTEVQMQTLKRVTALLEDKIAGVQKTLQ